MSILDEKNGSPLEIHPQHVVICRHGWEMREEVVPSFVKISTDFKTELPSIEGNSLKVWLFIALSINRNTEEAHPGIRTIALGTHLAQNSVIKAIQKLEALGLLTVSRDERKYNLYQVPNYVSANKKTASIFEAGASIGDETASTESESASIDDESASIDDETASQLVRLNQINQSNQSEPELNQTEANFNKKSTANNYWDTLLEIIQNDKEIPPANRIKIALGKPVAFQGGILTIGYPEPDWANARFARTFTNLIQGLCPGAAVQFTTN